MKVIKTFGNLSEAILWLIVDNRCTKYIEDRKLVMDILTKIEETINEVMEHEIYRFEAWHDYFNYGIDLRTKAWEDALIYNNNGDIGIIHHTPEITKNIPIHTPQGV